MGDNAQLAHVEQAPLTRWITTKKKSCAENYSQVKENREQGGCSIYRQVWEHKSHICIYYECTMWLTLRQRVEPCGKSLFQSRLLASIHTNRIRGTRYKCRNVIFTNRMFYYTTFTFWALMFLPQTNCPWKAWQKKSVEYLQGFSNEFSQPGDLLNGLHVLIKMTFQGKKQ